MQLIYISTRPSILNETLCHVQHFMPFIDEVIVLAPEEKLALVDSTIFPTTKFSDELLLIEKFKHFQKLDHQSKNYLLRSLLVHRSEVNDEFIMSDDDARPLRDISLDTFKSEEGYQSYFYYDLAAWKFGFGDFDRGQQTTYKILSFLGLPHLSYASHMPQIINKSILQEAGNFFSAYSANYPLCEWSAYFNYAQSRHNNLFLPPKPFRTLCWPDCPTCWPHYVKPEQPLFENFSPMLYERGQPFYGLPTELDRETQTAMSVEKIIRWYEYELGTQLPEYPVQTKSLFEASRDNFYWTLVSKPLRVIRRIFTLANWEQREDLTAIKARLDRIENILNSIPRSRD